MIVALINMDSSLVEGENKVLEDTKENLLSSEDALHENKVHEESSDKSKEITEKEENFKDHNSTEFINPEIKHEEHKENVEVHKENLEAHKENVLILMNEEYFVLCSSFASALSRTL